MIRVFARLFGKPIYSIDAFNKNRRLLLRDSVKAWVEDHHTLIGYIFRGKFYSLRDIR